MIDPTCRSEAFGRATEVYRVGCGIHDEYGKSKCNSRIDGPIGRIEKGNHVVLDKAAVVSRLCRESSEVILDRCERAYPPHEFNGDAVQGGGNVEPSQPSPAEGGESAANDEGNKSQVDGDDCIGENSVHHHGELIGVSAVLRSAVEDNCRRHRARGVRRCAEHVGNAIDPKQDPKSVERNTNGSECRGQG